MSFIHSVKLTKDSKTELVPALWKLRGVAFPSLVCRRESSRGRSLAQFPGAANVAQPLLSVTLASAGAPAPARCPPGTWSEEGSPTPEGCRDCSVGRPCSGGHPPVWPAPSHPGWANSLSPQIDREQRPQSEEMAPLQSLAPAREQGKSLPVREKPPSLTRRPLADKPGQATLGLDCFADKAIGSTPVCMLAAAHLSSATARPTSEQGLADHPRSQAGGRETTRWGKGASG